MKEDCTFFDKHTSFKGSISTPDEVVVEGHIQGEMAAARKVTILRGAEVRGPIRTSKILLQEGAYHLGALSLSDRTDALSFSDLDGLRPARFATSPPPASSEPAERKVSNTGKAAAPEKVEEGQEEPPEDSYQGREDKEEQEPVPAGFAGDPDSSDRLW